MFTYLTTVDNSSSWSSSILQNDSAIGKCASWEYIAVIIIWTRTDPQVGFMSAGKESVRRVEHVTIPSGKQSITNDNISIASGMVTSTDSCNNWQLIQIFCHRYTFKLKFFIQTIFWVILMNKSIDLFLYFYNSNF